MASSDNASSVRSIVSGSFKQGIIPKTYAYLVLQAVKAVVVLG